MGGARPATVQKGLKGVLVCLYDVGLYLYESEWLADGMRRRGRQTWEESNSRSVGKERTSRRKMEGKRQVRKITRQKSVAQLRRFTPIKSTTVYM